MKKVLIEKPSGKRPLGRPRQRWFDTTNRDMTRINAAFNINVASNRAQLRGITEAAKDLNGPFS